MANGLRDVLAGAAVELVTAENREYKLQAALKPFGEKYRYILLDCPPALDLLTLNALVSANAVLVPIQCEYLALEGVSELLDTLMRIQSAYDIARTRRRESKIRVRRYRGTQVAA